MRRIIECQVTDEYVRGDRMVVGAAGSHNDVALRLAFSPMWAGTARSIVWKDALGGNPIVTVLGTDLLETGETEVYIVPIPAEPKAYAGDMSMTIKGAVVDGDKETSATLTARAFFAVMESDWDEDAEGTQDITPTQAEQFQAQLEAIKDDIANAAKAAADAEAAENAAAVAAGAAKIASESEAAAQAAQRAAEAAAKKATEIAGGDFATSTEVNAAEENAKKYAREQDVETLNSANAYAQQQMVLANEYTDRKIEEIPAPQYAEVMMLASGWTGSTYSFEADYPNEQYNISIEVGPTATAEQFEAFGGAMICGSANSNIATALGDVPTVDIPIIVKVVAK